MERRKRRKTDKQHNFCVPYHPQHPHTEEVSTSAPEMSLIQQFHKLYNSHRAVSLPNDHQTQQYFGYNTCPNAGVVSQSHKRTFSQCKADNMPILPPAHVTDKSLPYVAPKHPPVVSKLVATPPSIQNCFKLTTQPYEKQRKAYQSEKR